ncbi:MAG TPA: hypothetical protein ENJ12_11985 [Thiolapillus brandeum]|uniref:JmjC domain-containing protein n=1 Tax=Thiolapillus brandeum TaxID=1076588 RepID=A0A831RWV9_9GAMM|nr:hypothetical protein [Thiolapillus brandeum]
MEAGQDFSKLLCADDVDQLLRYADANYRIVKYADGKSINYDVRKIVNAPDLYSVYEAWEQGYSISIDYLNRYWPALAELCQHLESVTHFRVAANIYFTPPGDQCFPPHYDGHEVIVLQVEGEKEWKVWDRKPEYTLEEGSPVENPESLPPPVMETTLKEGDVLYVPQGFPHQARTTEGRSLHITLQILPVTVTMFRGLILQAAEHLKVRVPDELRGSIRDSLENPGLGERLPPGFLDHEDLADSLQGWFEMPVRSRLVEVAKNAIIHGMTYDRQPATTGHFGFLKDIRLIDAGTVFRKRNQSLCTTGLSNGEPWLRFHRHRVVGENGMGELFRFISESDNFSLADLPEGVSEKAKKRVLGQLVRQGFLSIEHPE